MNLQDLTADELLHIDGGLDPVDTAIAVGTIAGATAGAIAGIALGVYLGGKLIGWW